MAEITVKGYANRPESKTSGGGNTYFTFSLSERQKTSKKGEPDAYVKVFYDCVGFDGGAPPDGSFVTVTGFLSVREYESKAGKDAGKVKQGLKINVKNLEVSPPRDGSPGGSGGSGAPAAPPSDPFGLGK